MNLHSQTPPGVGAAGTESTAGDTHPALPEDHPWEQVPAALKQRPTWVCWRREIRDGKPTKVPYNPTTGRRAKSNDPATWVDFATACARASQHDGIGIMFGSGLCGVDLDHCRDPETGELEPWATEAIAALNSYTEVSPSGSGVHVLLWAELPPGGRRKGRVEVYGPGSPRYFTVTGQHLSGTPPMVGTRQAELDAFHARFIGGAKPPAASPAPAAPRPTGLADMELLARAQAAKNGEEFSRLWEGGYPADDSAGDLKLCSHLAFWTGGDPARIDDLFRQSGRMREKWNRIDYRERTIAKALATTTEFYSPGGRGLPAASATATVTTRARELLGFRRTDAGNGEAMAFLYGDRLRYDKQRSRWLQWGGHVWVPAFEGDLTVLAKQAARERYLAASEADDAEQRKWAFGSESKHRVEAAVFFARGEPPIVDAGEGWDAAPWLLACPNGVVELGTGTFRPGQPADRLTLTTAVPYDPTAECPRWLRFLAEVFRDDTALLEFVWRAVGYSFTGSTREQIFFLLHGKGSNGKSLFLATLRHVLGDFAYSASFRVFDHACRNDHAQSLAQLEFKRFVTASEAAESCRLNEDRLKALAGSDPITANRMYQDETTFDNTAKVWLGVNHKPRVLDDTDGFWRKARLIQFSRQFVAPEKLAATPSLALDPNVLAADKDLGDKLKAEAAGILRWAVQGAALWAADGLREPPCVREASDAWREEADPLGDFFASCCVVSDKSRVRAGDLFAAYGAWCESLGMRERERMTQAAFGRRIAARFEKVKRASIGGKQGPAYYGIGLLEQREG